ncbi:MAG TPA: hypothetical protein VFC29_15095, partial [Candidatus Limnocylindrales bacterium]|nr:hypothetical protein [Candidatus Limnocylindrales bacterium]
QHYSTAPNGRGDLLQLVGFAGRTNASVSVRMPRASRSAVMHVPEAEISSRLEPVKVDGRQEYHLPSFSSSRF